MELFTLGSVLALHLPELRLEEFPQRTFDPTLR
jgi:hypothetical protein